MSRHMPVLRRCVAVEETTVLVARGYRPGMAVTGTFVLLLTSRSLVVSRESRLLRRAQMHLAVPLRDLSHVTWTADERASAVELAATVRGGIRERFWIPVRDPRRVRHIDALLSHSFRAEAVAPSTTLPVVPRRISPAGAF